MIPHSVADLERIRTLFQEFAESLSFALEFQCFAEELATLPGHYAPPAGRLYLAKSGSEAAGCVGVRSLGNGIWEMKRLYVRPRFRGQGLGRRLARASIEAARELGYAGMRLDTVSTMAEAIRLYTSPGFRAIHAYRYNPRPDAVYMELVLTART